MLTGIFRNHLKIPLGGGEGGILQLAEEILQLSRRLTHAVAQHILAVVAVAQQLGLLVAQLRHLAYHLVVVVLVATVATAVVGTPHLLAQGSIVGIGDKGAEGGVGKGECPTVQTSLVCLLPCGGNHVLRQSREVFLLRHVQDKVVVVSQHMLVHQLRQLCQTLAVLGKGAFVLAGEVHTVAHKALVGVL